MVIAEEAMSERTRAMEIGWTPASWQVISAMSRVKPTVLKMCAMVAVGRRESSSRGGRQGSAAEVLRMATARWTTSAAVGAELLPQAGEADAVAGGEDAGVTCGEESVAAAECAGSGGGAAGERAAHAAGPARGDGSCTPLPCDCGIC